MEGLDRKIPGTGKSPRPAKGGFKQKLSERLNLSSQNSERHRSYQFPCLEKSHLGAWYLLGTCLLHVASSCQPVISPRIFLRPLSYGSSISSGSPCFLLLSLLHPLVKHIVQQLSEKEYGEFLLEYAT